MSQGKAWNKDEVLTALEPYFLLGYNITEACEVAEFPRSTFQTWMNTDEELRLKVKSLQRKVSAKARQNIVQEIQAGDIGDSKWWLERKEPEDFAKKDKIEHSGDPDKPFYVELPSRKVDTPPRTPDRSPNQD